MSARVYFMNTANGCKDVSIKMNKMNSEDGQVYYCTVIFLFYYVQPYMQ